jgi:DNA-binding MarR family transcriptional regulator
MIEAAHEMRWYVAGAAPATAAPVVTASTPATASATERQPAEPQGTERQPTEPQPTEPQGTERQPTERQPAEPQPTGPRAARAVLERDATAREAWRAMLALTMGGSAPSRMHTVCQATDLTPAALKILLVLSDGPRPMRELVETFRHDPSYLTSVVDLLERRGVARREPHPTDRRAKTVVMTDEGREVLTAAQKILEVPPPSLRVLSPDEQRQLLALLLRVIEVEPAVPGVLRPRGLAEDIPAG